MKCGIRDCGSEDDVRKIMLRAPGVNKWFGKPEYACAACRATLKGGWRYFKQLAVTYET